MKKLILFLYLLLYCFGNAQQTNLAETQKLAEQGNITAQFDLAIAYENGDGVEKDYIKAAYWYTKAAEQGDADAQFNLGSLYYSGNGVEKSYEKAVYWWQKAAEQGNADAQEKLKTFYK